MNTIYKPFVYIVSSRASGYTYPFPTLDMVINHLASHMNMMSPWECKRYSPVKGYWVEGHDGKDIVCSDRIDVGDYVVNDPISAADLQEVIIYIDMIRGDSEQWYIKQGRRGFSGQEWPHLMDRNEQIRTETDKRTCRWKTAADGEGQQIATQPVS